MCPQVENPPKSRLHQQQRKSIQGERENFLNLEEGKEEIEGLMAMQDLAAMDRVSYSFSIRLQYIQKDFAHPV